MTNIIWLVSWIAVSVFSVPCPQPGPYIDEFGVVRDQNMMTLQMCYDSNKKEMQREFDTLDEAVEFVKGGVDKYGGKGFTSRAEGWRIEAVPAPADVDTDEWSILVIDGTDSILQWEEVVE